jgi:uncharacterized membrane protein YecN with MAPEG domain
MKHNVTLTITSLLSILFTSFHHADDVVRGMAPGKFSNLIPIFFLLVWLYGTLALAERRAGYVIILVASLLAAGLPVVHMRGVGFGFGTTRSGGFFFVWTLIVLGVIALFSFILAARALWNSKSGQSRSLDNSNLEESAKAAQ